MLRLRHDKIKLYLILGCLSYYLLSLLTAATPAPTRRVFRTAKVSITMLSSVCTLRIINLTLCFPFKKYLECQNTHFKIPPFII